MNMPAMGTLSFSAAATGGVTVSPRLVLLVASIMTACQVTGLGVGKPGIGNTCYNVFGNDTTTTCVNGGLPWKPDNASLPAANQTEAQCASDPCLNSECCKDISCEVGSKLHTECIADSNKKPPKKCFEGQCCGEDGKMDVSSTDCALCYPFIKCYPCFRSSKCSGAWYVPEILEYNCENIFTEPGLARLVTDGFLNVTLEDPPLTAEEIYRGKTATAIFSMTNESSKCSNSYYKLSCNDSVSDGIVTGAAFGSPVAIMCVPDPTDKTSVTPVRLFTGCDGYAPRQLFPDPGLGPTHGFANLSCTRSMCESLPLVNGAAYLTTIDENGTIVLPESTSQESNALDINGYYPLYTTMAASDAVRGTSHSHVFGGVTYYMPSGGTEGVDFFHGSYRPGGAAASLKSGENGTNGTLGNRSSPGTNITALISGLVFERPFTAARVEVGVTLKYQCDTGFTLGWYTLDWKGRKVKAEGGARTTRSCTLEVGKKPKLSGPRPRCVPAPPPNLRRFQVAPSGMAATAELEAPSVRSSSFARTTVWPCNEIFHDSDFLLGAGSKCRYATTIELAITFGKLPKLMVGNQIQLKLNAERAVVVGAPDNFNDLSAVTVLAPASLPYFSVGIGQVPSRIGRCDQIRPEVMVKTGSTGASARFEWDLSWGNPNIAKPKTSLPYLEIDSSSFYSLTGNMKISVVVSNLFGQAAIAESSFIRSNEVQPSIAIAGPREQKFYVSQDIFVSSIATMPAPTCGSSFSSTTNSSVSSSSPSSASSPAIDARTTFVTWALLSSTDQVKPVFTAQHVGPACSSDSETAKANRSHGVGCKETISDSIQDLTALRLKKGTLKAGHTYLFRATLWYIGAGNDGQQFSAVTATVQVRIVEQAVAAQLKVRIVGTTHPKDAATIDVPHMARIQLDATASFDPQDPASKDKGLAFKWNCLKVEATSKTLLGCGFPAGVLTTTGPLTDTVGPLTSKFVTYTFSVSVSRTQQTMTKYGVAAGTSSAAVEVRVMNSTSVPTVAIHPIPGKPPQGVPLVLSASVSDSFFDNSGNGLRTLLWSSQDVDLAVAKNLYPGSERSKLNLIIAVGVLEPGIPYTFTLSAARGTASNVGTSSITVITNAAPQLGTLSVEPASGSPLTRFTASAGGFFDDLGDLPLSYSFAFDLVGGDPSTCLAQTNAVGWLNASKTAACDGPAGIGVPLYRTCASTSATDYDMKTCVDGGSVESSVPLGTPQLKSFYSFFLPPPPEVLNNPKAGAQTRIRVVVADAFGASSSTSTHIKVAQLTSPQSDILDAVTIRLQNAQDSLTATDAAAQVNAVGAMMGQMNVLASSQGSQSPGSPPKGGVAGATSTVVSEAAKKLVRESAVSFLEKASKMATTQPVALQELAHVTKTVAEKPDELSLGAASTLVDIVQQLAQLARDSTRDALTPRLLPTDPKPTYVPTSLVADLTAVLSKSNQAVSTTVRRSLQQRIVRKRLLATKVSHNDTNETNATNATTSAGGRLPSYVDLAGEELFVSRHKHRVWKIFQSFSLIALAQGVPGDASYGVQSRDIQSRMVRTRIDDLDQAFVRIPPAVGDAEYAWTTNDNGRVALPPKQSLLDALGGAGKVVGGEKLSFATIVDVIAVSWTVPMLKENQTDPRWLASPTIGVQIRHSKSDTVIDAQFDGFHAPLVIIPIHNDSRWTGSTWGRTLDLAPKVDFLSNALSIDGIRSKAVECQQTVVDSARPDPGFVQPNNYKEKNLIGRDYEEYCPKCAVFNTTSKDWTYESMSLSKITSKGYAFCRTTVLPEIGYRIMVEKSPYHPVLYESIDMTEEEILRNYIDEQIRAWNVEYINVAIVVATCVTLLFTMLMILLQKANYVELLRHESAWEDHVSLSALSESLRQSKPLIRRSKLAHPAKKKAGPYYESKAPNPEGKAPYSGTGAMVAKPYRDDDLGGVPEEGPDQGNEKWHTWVEDIVALGGPTAAEAEIDGAEVDDVQVNVEDDSSGVESDDSDVKHAVALVGAEVKAADTTHKRRQTLRERLDVRRLRSDKSGKRKQTSCLKYFCSSKVARHIWCQKNDVFCLKGSDDPFFPRTVRVLAFLGLFFLHLGFAAMIADRSHEIALVKNSSDSNLGALLDFTIDRRPAGDSRPTNLDGGSSVVKYNVAGDGTVNAKATTACPNATDAANATNITTSKTGCDQAEDSIPFDLALNIRNTIIILIVVTPIAELFYILGFMAARLGSWRLAAHSLDVMTRVFPMRRKEMVAMFRRPAAILQRGRPLGPSAWTPLAGMLGYQRATFLPGKKKLISQWVPYLLTSVASIMLYFVAVTASIVIGLGIISEFVIEVSFPDLSTADSKNVLVKFLVEDTGRHLNFWISFGASLALRPVSTQPLLGYLLHLLSRSKKCCSTGHADKHRVVVSQDMDVENEPKPPQRQQQGAKASSQAVTLNSGPRPSHLTLHHFQRKLRKRAADMPPEKRKLLPWPKDFPTSLGGGAALVRNRGAETSLCFSMLHRLTRKERMAGLPLKDPKVKREFLKDLKEECGQVENLKSVTLWKAAIKWFSDRKQGLLILSSLYAYPEIHRLDATRSRSAEAAALRDELSHALSDFHRARLKRNRESKRSRRMSASMRAAGARYAKAIVDHRSPGAASFENGSFVRIAGSAVGEVLVCLLLNKNPVVYVQIYTMMEEPPKDMSVTQKHDWVEMTTALTSFNIARYACQAGNADFFPLGQISGVVHMVEDCWMPGRNCFLRIPGRQGEK